VVEGVSGQAVAQRAVVSEHRSEADAREAAARERARLEVIHGADARAWRILVVLGDEVVAEEMPSAEGEDLLAAARPAPAPAEPPAAGGDDAGEPAAEGAEPAEAPEPPPPPEPPPEGPVPDWVIKRIEESIARRGDRETGPEPPEGTAPPDS
jgi:hypothetical protein